MTFFLTSLRGTQCRSNPGGAGTGPLSTRTTCAGQGTITMSMAKHYCVYLMTNRTNTVLCNGVTSHLQRRAYEHKERLADGLSKKYKTGRPVYYEVFDDIEHAIVREKQIKAGSRQKKTDLVNTINSQWRDLYDEL